jgi:hypothetical protein
MRVLRQSLRRTLTVLTAASLIGAVIITFVAFLPVLNPI